MIFHIPSDLQSSRIRKRKALGHRILRNSKRVDDDDDDDDDGRDGNETKYNSVSVFGRCKSCLMIIHKLIIMPRIWLGWNIGRPRVAP